MNKISYHNNSRCILLTGNKHSGKTTAIAKLINTLQQQGYTVGGILAPSIYEGDKLIGFDIINLQTNQRKNLSRLNIKLSGMRSFEFTKKGSQFGQEALAPEKIKHCDFIVIDEFGPFEIKGHGWRNEIDLLLEVNIAPLVIVVREELKKAVQDIYGVPETSILDAQDSITMKFLLSIINNKAI